jgi:hypothetical protein
VSRNKEFKQSALFAAHKPEDLIESAVPWAQKQAGKDARVHYVSPEQNVYASGQHRVSVSVPGMKGQPRRTVSYLDWSPTNGMVTMVSTQSEHRDKGLASGLWHVAKALGEEYDNVDRVQHSDVQTPMGKQWARKVGD